MKKTVILYGPLSEKVSGGFDRMNHNIYNTFKNDNDIKIIKLPMLKMKIQGVFKIPMYPFFYIVSFLYSFFMLLYHKLKYRPHIFHITAVTTFLYRDIFIIFLAKLLSLEVVYDIRAGIFILNYADFKKRIIYKLNFKLSSLILVEGKKYIPFLKLKDFDANYFPNYTFIDKEFKIQKYTSNGILKFIYIGRVIKSKGIEDSIKILEFLNKHYKIKLEFNIIGDYNENYKIELSKKYGDFFKNVKFLGYMDKEEINSYLLSSDFFMFLSSWEGEGHSNALNEAMSHGIPLFFYNQGFTREIIDNDNFMLPNFKNNLTNIYNTKLLKEISTKIFELIMDENYINKEKQRLQKVVLDNYSLEKLKIHLKRIYTKI
jgi:glycosyltransferase involved in cell wall biosynthesis